MKGGRWHLVKRMLCPKAYSDTFVTWPMEICERGSSGRRMFRARQGRGKGANRSMDGGKSAVK